MPKSRNRYSRTAMRAKYRKPKRRRGGSMGWNVAIATVVVVGVVAIVLDPERRHRQSEQQPAARRQPDHRCRRRSLAHLPRGQHLRRVAEPGPGVREGLREPERARQRRDPLPRRRPHPHPPLRHLRAGCQRDPRALPGQRGLERLGGLLRQLRRLHVGGARVQTERAIVEQRRHVQLRRLQGQEGRARLVGRRQDADG